MSGLTDSVFLGNTMKKEIQQLIRIANTDLDGEKEIGYALRNIKGIGFMAANAICNYLEIDHRTKGGDLTEDQVKKLEAAVKDPTTAKLPSWLLNRRKDYDSGVDRHLILAELDFAKDNDIKRLKKIKAYRGVRHIYGLPTRGQRTKSNFRKNKGKSSLGVKRREGAKIGK